jgi:transcriptional regulator with XRE-family HTH domain
MTADTRKPLEDWQVQDAARLKRLFESRSELSQLEFGSEFEIGSQGVVWQYLNGHIPLNLSAAIKFARGLGAAVKDFSPTLALQLGQANHAESNAIAQIYEAMPEPEKQAALDFIHYRYEHSELLASEPEKWQHYVKMIEKIKADMAKRTKRRR